MNKGGETQTAGTNKQQQQQQSDTSSSKYVILLLYIDLKLLSLVTVNQRKLTQV